MRTILLVLALWLAGAPALASYTPASPLDFGASGNLASTDAAAVTITNAPGYSFVRFRLDVPSGATVAFQSSPDGGTTWSSMHLRAEGDDTQTSSTSTDDVYQGSIAGASHWRVLVTSAGSGTGTVQGRMTFEAATLETLEHGPADDFSVLAAANEVEGLSADRWFAKNPDIDTVATETLWNQGGSYTFSAAASTWYLMSTSGSDTNVDVTCRLLNSSYVGSDVSVNSNGTTPIAFSGTWFRTNGCHVSGAIEPVGTLYVGTSNTATSGVPDDATTIRGRIDIGRNVTEESVHTVENDRAFYLQHYSVHTSGGNSTFQIYMRPEGGVFQVVDEGLVTNGASLDVPLTVPIRLPEHTDVKVEITTDTNNTKVVGSLQGFDRSEQ